MSMPKDSLTEAKRLEDLWSTDFGDAYTDRNSNAGERRAPFWNGVLNELPARRVLEVGCNIGANLRWIAAHDSVETSCGIDINIKALRELHRALPGANALWSRARELPFRDESFDLVFTMGVLIHQPPEHLPIVMSEIVRCSRRFILCGEYFSDQLTEIPYRGETGALYKRNFGGLYQQLFAGLVLHRQGFLSRAEGWDDITYWVFEKQELQTATSTSELEAVSRRAQPWCNR